MTGPTRLECPESNASCTSHSETTFYRPNGPTTELTITAASRSQLPTTTVSVPGLPFSARRLVAETFDARSTHSLSSVLRRSRFDRSARAETPPRLTISWTRDVRDEARERQ